MRRGLAAGVCGHDHLGKSKPLAPSAAAPPRKFLREQETSEPADLLLSMRKIV